MKSKVKPLDGIRYTGGSGLVLSELSPNHFIYDTGVGLDNLDHLGGDVFLNIIRNRDAEVTDLIHGDRSIHRLQKSLFVNAGKDEARLVKCLRAFR